MTLVPIHRLNRLAEPDALVWRTDERPEVDVILAIKDSTQQTPVAALRELVFTWSQLVPLEASWVDGHPELVYGVEKVESGPEAAAQRLPEALTLYRYADYERRDGEWWSPRPYIARQEGGGRHRDPKVWSIEISRSRVLAEFVCRFGNQFAPSEHVIDTEGLAVETHL